MLPLVALALCCIIGAVVFYLIWTAPDWTVEHRLPDVSEMTIDFEKYPVIPGHDWTGLV